MLRPQACSPRGPGPSSRSTGSLGSTSRSISHAGSSKDGLPRAWRAKPCVCALSGQLARDRSRLLKADQLINQGIHRLAFREDALDDVDAQVSSQELALAERRRAHAAEEHAASVALETARMHAEEARGRQFRLQEQGRQTAELREALLQRRQEVQQRLEATGARRRRLAEECGEADRLRSEAEVHAAATEALAEAVEARQLELSEATGQCSAAASRADARRAAVRARQDALDFVRHELESKEADLDEREALCQRRSAALAERESRLDRGAAELAAVRAAEAEARRSAEESERRLTALWDDIHQRQQVLEDIGSSLYSREERLSIAEHSLVCQEAEAVASDTWHPGRDTEQAWRERSFSLVDRKELLAQIRLLEAGAPAPFLFGQHQKRGAAGR